MSQLTDHLVTDKRGRFLYIVEGGVPFAEKSNLLEQFVKLHFERKYWSVRMHMPKRNMPFTVHGTVSFKSNNKTVNKMIVHFNQASIVRNSDEVKLVWHHMQPHMLRIPLHRPLK
jgi:hypothetical protein